MASETRPCPSCGGTGEVAVTVAGGKLAVTTCANCEGSKVVPFIVPEPVAAEAPADG